MINAGFGMFGWDFCCLGWCRAALLVFWMVLQIWLLWWGLFVFWLGLAVCLHFLPSCACVDFDVIEFRMSVCSVWVVCVDLGVWVGISGILLVLIFAWVCLGAELLGFCWLLVWYWLWLFWVWYW